MPWKGNWKLFIYLFRLGRRKALVAFTGISALFFLPVAVVQLLTPLNGPTYHESLYIGAIVLGKFCVAAARHGLMALTLESYPVAIRTMGFRISRVSSTLGAMVAPLVAFLGSSKCWLST